MFRSVCSYKPDTVLTPSAADDSDWVPHILVAPTLLSILRRLLLVYGRKIEGRKIEGRKIGGRKIEGKKIEGKKIEGKKIEELERLQAGRLPGLPRRSCVTCGAATNVVDC